MMLRCASISLLLLQTYAVVGPDDVKSDKTYFHYQRDLLVPGRQSGQVCATLDATVFAHAATESLNDLRVYAGKAEVPFTLTESGTERVEEEPAAVRNAVLRNGELGFDLEMPQRPYTAVDLDLNAKDFLAVATVTGLGGSNAAPVPLGSFAMFDLNSKHLGRSTTLPLQESAFPQVRVFLRIKEAPGSPPGSFGPQIVRGASVPPSREAQTLFTTVAETGNFARHSHQSVATFQLPAHVPVERVSVVLDPGFHKDFLRTVTITARPDHVQDSAAVESLSGEVSHVRLPAEIAEHVSQAEFSKLSIDSALGANLQGSAAVEVAVENGKDQPLPIRSVRLSMRERRLCFERNGSGPYKLVYGSAGMRAPKYAYAQGFAPSTNARKANLGPEELNPSYAPHAGTASMRQRHLGTVWVLLMGVLLALGMVAFRGAHKRR